MKRTKIYFILLLSIIIINSISYAEWQKDGNLEWLKISNSAIKQYVFSQDGKSVYVIDSSNTFLKYDIETGKMIWIKNLTSAKYEDYAFAGAQISEDADYYLVWFVKDKYTFSMQLRDIEKDNIINSLPLATHLREGYTYAYLYPNNYFISSSKYILFLESWENNYYYIGMPEVVTIAEKTGTISYFKIMGDTIHLNRTLDLNFPLAFQYNNISNFFIGSFYYKYDYSHHSPYPDGNYQYFDRYYRTYFYDLKNDSLYLLTKTPYSKLTISNDGKFWIGINDSTISSFSMNLENTLHSIKSLSTISSIICSYDDKFLLFGSLNEIRIHNLVQLDVIDTLKFPNLNDYIYQIQYSPDKKYLYFSSNKHLNRIPIDTQFQNNYINAFFYPDTTIIEVNQPIHFYDASTKNAKTFLWDFGDGTTSKEQNPIHKYADTGYFDVKLIVSDGTNQDTFLIKNCVHILPELRADFDIKIYESELPVKVNFINKSVGSIDSLEWDFGDYSQSKEYSPTHYYRYNDTFKVNLKIYCRFLEREITKQVVINSTQSQINTKEWKYEAMFKDTSDMAAINGIELSGEKIVFIQDRDNTPYSLNSKGDLLWHKVWDSTSGFSNGGYRCSLQKYPINFNYFIYGQNDLVAIFDKKCEMINHYNTPKVKIDVNYSLIQPLEEILLNGTSINLVIRNLCSDVNFILNTVKLDFNLGLISYQNFLNVKFHPLGKNNFNSFNSSSQIRIIFNDTSADYILRLYSIGYEVPPPRGDGYKWEYLQFIVNNTILYGHYNEIPIGAHYPNPAPFQYGYYYLYNSFIRLNDKTLIVAFQDTTVKFFNNQNKITKNLRYDGMYFTSLITLDSVNFLAAGSINDSPGYAIINDAGKVVKTVILPGRYGAFNSIAITPDTNLLFSGYQFIDKELHRRPYFAKTNSEDIRERIKRQIRSTSVDEPQYEGNITIYPNPTNNEIHISGIKDYGGWSYTICNLVGQIISKGNLESNTISISELPKGMYFITLEYQGKIIPLKFIKD
ncbi:MAG TPA: PKD domain-containing protein [Bacteroidota bacterium]|nr:PKD domain-containing protein [Bacteroidota bacterium]